MACSFAADLANLLGNAINLLNQKSSVKFNWSDLLGEKGSL